MTFRDLIRRLEQQGFQLDRQRSIHRVYKGHVEGRIRIIVVACHREKR